MALLLDPKVGARTTLANYLRTNMASAWPNLVVSENWPTPQRAFPPQAITVITPTTAARAQDHEPVVWKVVPTSGVNANVLYSYSLMELDLQIDIWAQYESVRDDLVATVGPLLNQNVNVTLGTTNNFYFLPLAPGLVLPMPTYYSINGEYKFFPAPSPYETPDAAMVGEWRATFAGEVTMSRMDQQVLPMVQTLTIKETFNGQATPDILPAPLLFITTQNWMLTRASSFTFQALMDIGGAYTDVTSLATWASDNTSSLTLTSGSTFATAASAGTAHVTASYNGLVASSTVTVL